MFYPSKINYVLISDGFSNYNFVEDYLINKETIGTYNDLFICSSISDLYKEINNNKTIRVDNKDYYLKKVLRESDVLIINVGMKELSNTFDKYDINNNYQYLNKLYYDMQNLINEINKYAYGKIIFIGFYNPTNYYDAKIDSFFYEIDSKLMTLLTKNNIEYISTYEIMKNR